MPYSFNPKIIYESMTLYRFFCICLHQHEQRVHCTVSSSVVLSREGDRSLGLYCSTIHYYTLYTAFCSNAGWGHVFCFCCPSISRQWRGRGLKTLCELTVEDWGLGYEPRILPRPGTSPATATHPPTHSDILLWASCAVVPATQLHHSPTHQYWSS